MIRLMVATVLLNIGVQAISFANAAPESSSMLLLQAIGGVCLGIFVGLITRND